FETKVRPVLAEQCYSCHGEKKQSAGLRLDSKAAVTKGSDGGPVVVPGEPEKSPLVQAIRHSGEIKMPPKKQLPAEAVEALTAWVKLGAPYPDDAAAGPDLAKAHWAFQPVKDPTPPATKADLEHPVDRFVQARLEAKGHTLSLPADRRTLIRRVTYDLTGMLPTPAEVEAFAKDDSPLAYERLVDRLLDSPHYGEHQARHWMDLSRYADTKGYVFTEDRNYPFAFTYRDWVIRSFNQDLPYDQFVLYQLAADRVVTNDKANLAAMGFLTLGRRFLNNQSDIIDDRIDVTFRTFQGLTVTCARCHDHKYDPIPTKDYYSLYGVFASSQEPKDLPLIETPKDTPEVRAFEAEMKKRDDLARETFEKLKADYLAKLRSPAAVADYLRAVREAFGMGRDRSAAVAAERKLVAVVLDSWQRYLAGRTKDDAIFRVYLGLASIPDGEFQAKSPAVLAEALKVKAHPAVAEAFEKPPASFDEVCERYARLLTAPGDDKAIAGVLGSGGPLDLRERQFNRVFTVAEKQKVERLQRAAAEWKAKSPVAPARAMVITEGPMTEPVVFLRGNPNNRGPQVPRQFPELLAGKERKPFSDGSGRLEMAKAIADAKNPLTSRVLVNRVWGHLFGQALVRTPSDLGTRSDPPTHPELLDWLAARFVESGWSVKKLHRLIVTSAAYRQSSAVPPDLAKADPENRLLARMSRKRLTFEGLRDGLLTAAGRLDGTVGGRSVDLFQSPFSTRRAVYGFIDRQNLPGTYRSFDVALPDTHAPQRFTTTVPQQALFLMNAPFVLEQAKAMADRVREMDPAARVVELYRLAYARRPTADELRVALDFVQAPPPEGTKLGPWEQLAQALLVSNEFAFVD
ncbi:MAG TPA: PSD1 and planctomycete cytochrome C domain-containing protein, partial [Gemmataceae bacterium]|nr:PSD1 and planctomycete cytochrome C domain-containing protein [Gemmataceae bacterium]